MLKLHKATDTGIAYHEAWVDGDRVVEHWGMAGERGQLRHHDLEPDRSELDNVTAVLAAALAEGYAEVPDEEYRTLVIVYAVEGMGNSAEAAKQRDLQARMDELLRGTGLGQCEGGSVGSGAMDVRCSVVDFELAKRVIQADLAGTLFANYGAILDETAADEVDDSEDYPDDADGDALRRIQEGGSDMAKPMVIDFAVLLPDELHARQFAAVAKQRDFEVLVSFDDDGACWTCYCTRTMRATYGEVRAVQEELDEISRPFGGHSDGWGTFGNRSSE